ncbi:MAG: hypothetical protein KF847_17180 [Pirellulales bacterium]|nr:hypothetical protein [Pirellulales bacterium]
MSDAPPLLILIPVAALLAIGLAPSRLANRCAIAAVRWVPRLAVGVFFAAMLVGIELGTQPRPLAAIGAGEAPVDLVYWTGGAWIMVALVSAVGWVVARYSARYLDGDSDQGAYFCRVGGTIGAAALMALAGNLLIMVGAWSAACASLHRLLTHRKGRPVAAAGAQMKLVVDRLGDLLLAGALLLAWQAFGTLNLADLIAAGEQRIVAGQVDSAMTAFVWFAILGTAVKSAQFPFSFWLPETLDTPTPVSALMHAGIVNAGGYALVRLSPVLVAAPTALAMLAIVGVVTALVGGVAMLAQTSVKRSLAYSTIAQMGFMMFQCGLGAFAAAMLHIVAHSLYKAYAFLASGEVLVVAAAQEPVGQERAPSVPPARRLAIAACLVLGAYLATTTACGISPTTKPGGHLLGGLLCLALVRRAWHLLEHKSPWRRGYVVLSTTGLCLAYAANYLLVEAALSGSVPAVGSAPATWAAAALLLAAFGALFLGELRIADGRTIPWRHALYVHALNGFYAEAFARRGLRSLST